MPPVLCRFLLILGCLGFALAALVAGFSFPLIPAGILLLAGHRELTRHRGSSWSHGSARFASWLDLMRFGLFTKRGLMLGRAGRISPPPCLRATLDLVAGRLDAALACRAFLAAWQGNRWLRDQTIRVNNFVHLGTFAPSGKGKSIYVLVPNLLSYLLNCVVIDPKGELTRLTAAFRRRVFSHQIICIDPFGVTNEPSATLNPLTCIDPRSGEFLDDCRNLANLLVPRSGKEQDPHWLDSAEVVLTAFIAFVCACETDPKLRHLGLVRDLVSSRFKYLVSVETMQEMADHPVIQRLGNQLSWFVDRELGSVLTTVNRLTSFLDSPVVAGSLAHSSFDPTLLRTGACTIYLCLPHDRLVTLAPLNRLWLGTILRAITRGTACERNEVLFLIDEAAHLGKIQILEDAVTLMRGMGIRLWFFFQSLSQLHECYGDRAPVILENLDTQQYFGTNAYQTAEEISKRIGDRTVGIASRNDTQGRSAPTSGYTPGSQGSVSTSSSLTYSDTGRRLLKPEEILGLPNDLALTFHRNLPPIRATLVAYFDDPAFSPAKGRRLDVGLAAFGMLILGAFSLVTALGLAAGNRPPLPSPPAPMPADPGNLGLPPAPPFLPPPGGMGPPDRRGSFPERSTLDGNRITEGPGRRDHARLGHAWRQGDTGPGQRVHRQDDRLVDARRHGRSGVPAGNRRTGRRPACLPRFDPARGDGHHLASHPRGDRLRAGARQRLLEQRSARRGPGGEDVAFARGDRPRQHAASADSGDRTGAFPRAGPRTLRPTNTSPGGKR